MDINKGNIVRQTHTSRTGIVIETTVHDALVAWSTDPFAVGTNNKRVYSRHPLSSLVAVS
jgi:hypothetical protein